MDKAVLDKIDEYIAAKDIPNLKLLMAKHNLEVKDGKIFPKNLVKSKSDFVFWDQRQLIKKIQLNSLYGALTNEGSHFYDQRMGQSITLTGRSIARYMAGTINKILTDEFDPTGICISYGDTDSTYFSAWPIRDILAEQDFEFTEDSAVELYDSVAAATNETFKPYMMSQYNCIEKRAGRIKANREICARSALFVKKKRYAVLVYDKEGVRFASPKLKVMGMDTQRADTPTFVQNFLKTILMRTLSGDNEDVIIDLVKKFRIQFKSKDPWHMGTPKRCNGLTKYTNMENASKNSRLPGHIRAAYNWNWLKKAMGDNQSMNVPDGGKTVVCRLKDNQFGITSISYPIDQVHNLPEWFKTLPFDVDSMEFKLIDKKLGNIIGLMKFDLNKSKQNEAVSDLFSFK